MPFKAAFSHFDRDEYRHEQEKCTDAELEAKYHKKTMLLTSSSAGVVSGVALAEVSLGVSLLGSV